MGYEGNEYVVYQTVIVLADLDNVYFMADDVQDAFDAGRDWLAEEIGGREEDYELVSGMTAEEIADKILDYDHVAFCDVAQRVVLFG
jgi:hypothetical protein